MSSPVNAYIPEYQKDVEAIQGRLDDLTGLGGADADSVANELRNLGLKGVRCSARDCIVARAIEAVKLDHPITALTVNSLGVNVWLGNRGYFHTFPVSEAIASFIYRFDKGLYPDLVDPKSLAYHFLGIWS